MRGRRKWRTMMLPLTQRGGELAGIPLRVAGEDEVGGGGQHFEAERGQFLHKAFAALHDGQPGDLEVRVVLHRRDGAGDGEAVERDRS